MIANIRHSLDLKNARTSCTAYLMKKSLAKMQEIVKEMNNEQCPRFQSNNKCSGNFHLQYINTQIPLFAIL